MEQNFEFYLFFILKRKVYNLFQSFYYPIENTKTLKAMCFNF